MLWRVLLCLVVVSGCHLTNSPSQTSSADPAERLAAAQALLAAGENESARSEFQALVQANEKDGAAWFGLARAQQAMGQHQQAARSYERSHALGQAERPSLLGAARAWAASGDSKSAMKRLEALAAMGPPGHTAVQAAAELAPLRSDPRFAAIVEALRPCAQPAYRQFDFWLGDWDVRSTRAAPGTPPSRNLLTSLDDGCAVLEQYSTPGGYTGTSISYYDPQSKQWIQSWMDNQGQAILHRGGLDDAGNMVLIDDPVEGRPLNRTTWTPREDGTVRQHWESSQDGGETWTTVFDGTYTRRSPG